MGRGGVLLSKFLGCFEVGAYGFCAENFSLSLRKKKSYGQRKKKENEIESDRKKQACIQRSEGKTTGGNTAVKSRRAKTKFTGKLIWALGQKCAVYGVLTFFMLRSK